MPARREWTPDELRERLERQRALTRERVARLRERRRVTRYAGAVLVTDGAVRVTAAPETGPLPVTPPHTPPVSSFSLKERRERRKIEQVLAAFAERGYRHDPRFWELLQERYPALDLELEVLKLAEWLEEPRNAKRKCSKGFITNWLSKADVDRQQREAQARTLPPTATAATPAPPGGPKNPGPPPVLPEGVTMERIDPAVAARALAEAKRLTLAEKLARAAANGRPA
jgi:hypothetical protein